MSSASKISDEKVEEARAFDPTSLIGKKFYFEGDWQTVDGFYEVVAVHDDGDFPRTYDCREETPVKTKEGQPPISNGWWASVVESKLREDTT
ncbi:MAG TPA: hypothetical protein DCS66_16835 [Flavobacteriaceae bacterium]|nr:hypothetical protein [Flavobacteriaceae bacterium]|tara:strand:+ start:556 stop:831 length:276 start_codon:yes stop_codon:yes gene_type:complete